MSELGTFTLTAEPTGPTRRRSPAASSSDEGDLSNAPLFAVEDPDQVQQVMCFRTGPVSEGLLGKYPPSVVEDDIKQQWGGGTYKLEARDVEGRVMKGGVKLITIAGDPKFQSREARAKYKNMMAMEDEALDHRPAGAGGAPGFTEMLSLITTMQGLAEDRAAQAHARQLEILKADSERRIREAKEESERRERDLRDREAQLRRESEERIERERKASEEARERDRLFQTTLFQMREQKGSTGNDTLQIFLQGLQFAKRLEGFGGGDDEPDPVSLFMKNLPDILGRVGGLMGGAKSEPQQAPQAAQLAPAPKPPAAPQTPPQAPAAAEDVVFRGELAKDMRETVQALQGAGVNPQEALQVVLRSMAAQARAQAAPPPGGAAPLPPPQGIQKNSGSDPGVTPEVVTATAAPMAAGVAEGSGAQGATVGGGVTPGGG